MKKYPKYCPFHGAKLRWTLWDQTKAAVKYNSDTGKPIKERQLVCQIGCILNESPHFDSWQRK